jgi:gliding motility-associated-like protein
MMSIFRVLYNNKLQLSRTICGAVWAIFIAVFYGSSDLSAQSEPELDIPQHEYSICSEEPVTVDVYVYGDPQVFIRYDFEGTVYQVNSSSEHIQLILSEPGTYLVFEFGDRTTLVSNKPDSFTIALNPAPSLEFTGGGINCSDGHIDPLVIHFYGEPPFILDFLFNGSPLQIQTVNTQLTFPTDQSYTIETQYLTDSLCGTGIITTANYIFIEVPQPVILGDTVSCMNETEIYYAGNSDYMVEWDIPGGGDFIEGINENGPYVTVTWTESGPHQVFLRYTEPLYNCQTDWEVLPVSIYGLPGVSGVIDTTVCFELGDILNIDLETTEGEQVFWPGLNYLGSYVNLTAEGTYTFIYSNEYNCTDTGMVIVSSNCLSDIHVPEAFTPNGDNLNDYLEIFGLFSNLDFRVYSPSGVLLYQTTNPDQPWDGRYEGSDVPAGSYCWHAIISDGDSESKEKSGVVTIIR